MDSFDSTWRTEITDILEIFAIHSSSLIFSEQSMWLPSHTGPSKGLWEHHMAWLWLPELDQGPSPSISALAGKTVSSPCRRTAGAVPPAGLPVGVGEKPDLASWVIQSAWPGVLDIHVYLDWLGLFSCLAATWDFPVRDPHALVAAILAFKELR